MRTALVLTLLLAAAPIFGLDGSNVLVIANENVEGSVEIAEYYAGLRNVPEDQILKIKAPGDEEITREQFNSDIRDPVAEYVRGNADILVIVPTRGVPLKIKETDTANDASVQDNFIPGRDFASVDSEIMLIRAGEYEIEGAAQNPWFESEDRLDGDAQVVVVSRLDGPSVEIAKGLVEKAVLAEALGCGGESLLDTRGPGLEGGYKERDDVMLKVKDAWDSAGLKYAHDQKPEVVDLSTRDETLHYYGWYAGNQNPAGRVRFRTGAIAVHLHSFSAATVRRDDRNWVGPLLSWGCTATYGAVYEPLTVGFPFENIFWDRLVQGFSFGEAGLAANRLLSWNSVFVGDPLYTPYAEGAEDSRESYRTALLQELSPDEGGEAVVVDRDNLPLLDACRDMLATRAEEIEGLTRSDQAGALAAFNRLRGLVKGMALGEWIGVISEPFKGHLDDRFDEMKRRIKQDLTDTDDFEAALVDWEGMSIHEELLEFKEDLADDQERHAGRLVNRAERYVERGRHLDGYILAAEAAALKFAESAVRAREVVKELEGDQAAMDTMKEDANKQLEGLVRRLEHFIEREDWGRAQRLIGREWRFYPDCEQRRKLVDFHEQITAGLAEEG